MRKLQDACMAQSALWSRAATIVSLFAALVFMTMACNGASRETPTATPPQPSPTSTAPGAPTATTVPSLTFPLCDPNLSQGAGAFTTRVRAMELGFRTSGSSSVPAPQESLLVAGDLNIVDVRTIVQYRIRDLEAYVSNVADPEGCPDGLTLRDSAQAALSQVVGQRPMDHVMLDKRAEVQADTHALLQQILDSYGTGIQVLGVLLQEVRPPEQVRDAYDDVDRARQDKETLINQAQAYEGDIIPRTRGEAERILRAAEAFRQERAVQAEGEAERFVSVLREYAQEEDVAFRGLYLEAMEGILPGVGQFIRAAGEGATSSKASLPYAGYVASGLSGSATTSSGAPALYIDAERVLPKISSATGLPSPNSGADLDDRLLLLDLPPAVLPDVDKQFLVLDIYLLYRIVSGEEHLRKLFGEARTLESAEERIGRIVASNLREEVAIRTREEIIGARIAETAEGERVVVPAATRQEILDRVLAAANDVVGPGGGNYGVEVVDVRLKRVSFPEAVQESIYSRMRAERRRISQQSRAEGAEEEAKIRAAADKERAIILAEAQKRAGEIEAEGEATAIDLIVQALDQVPELSSYQKSLKAYKIARG